MANTENIRKWVDALRSGEYAQRKGFLNRNGRYCCLGVACEVALQNGVAVDKQLHYDNDQTYYYDGTGGWLPEPVRWWLGVEGPDVIVTYEGETVGAADLNDTRDASFADIADAIEATYLKEELLTERVPAMTE